MHTFVRGTHILFPETVHEPSEEAVDKTHLEQMSLIQRVNESTVSGFEEPLPPNLPTLRIRGSIATA